jgi:hypothetical protein
MFSGNSDTGVLDKELMDIDWTLIPNLFSPFVFQVRDNNEVCGLENTSQKLTIQGN